MSNDTSVLEAPMDHGLRRRVADEVAQTMSVLVKQRSQKNGWGNLHQSSTVSAYIAALTGGNNRLREAERRISGLYLRKVVRELHDAFAQTVRLKRARHGDFVLPGMKQAWYKAAAERVEAAATGK